MASLGNTPGLIIAAGVGAAASVALEPAFEVPKQDAWSRLPNRILDPAIVARLVAQGGVVLGNPDGSTKGSAYADARREGFMPDKLDALIYLAQTVPGFAEALAAWRRFDGTDTRLADFAPLWSHSLIKNAVDPRYYPYLNDLKNEKLSAQAVALGIIRGLIPDPGFFPVTLDTSGGVVKTYQASTIKPILEAAAEGFDEERLRVMVGSIGRPPGPSEGARAFFRGLIERPDFNRLILEGDTRPEWADTFLNVSREILTAHDYAELELRGFLDRNQRLAQTDKHGMSHADSDLLYDVLGRSIPEHQIVTGEARGGTFEGPVDTIPKAFLQSLQRGNLRPEYYNLAYHNRYSYPSAFFFRLLLSDGTITAAQAEQRFLEIGWPPDLAKEIATALAAKAPKAKGDPWIAKAENQLWTASHKAFVKQGTPRSVVEPALTTFIPELAVRDAIFQLWIDEKAVDAGTVPGP